MAHILYICFAAGQLQSVGAAKTHARTHKHTKETPDYNKIGIVLQLDEWTHK